MTLRSIAPWPPRARVPGLPPCHCHDAGRPPCRAAGECPGPPKRLRRPATGRPRERSRAKVHRRPAPVGGNGQEETGTWRGRRVPVQSPLALEFHRPGDRSQVGQAHYAACRFRTLPVDHVDKERCAMQRDSGQQEKLTSKRSGCCPCRQANPPGNRYRTQLTGNSRRVWS